MASDQKLQHDFSRGLAALYLRHGIAVDDPELEAEAIRLNAQIDERHPEVRRAFRRWRLRWRARQLLELVRSWWR